MSIDIAGGTLALLAERVLFWPRTATKIVADPHLGKTDSFQVAGAPIPDGATEADLARLSACITATGASRLVILGDFFHTQASQSAQTLAARQSRSARCILFWRSCWWAATMTVTPGRRLPSWASCA